MTAAHRTRRPAAGRGNPATALELPTAAIPVSDLHPSPTNPRKHFDAERLEELAASVEVHGVLQPLIVRKRPRGKGFEIVIGERRYRAAKKAGLATVPALVRDDISDGDALEIQLIENVQRDDLSALEEGDSYRMLMDDRGMSVEEIVARTGKSRSTVYARRKLADLAPKARKLVQEERLSTSVGILVAGVPDRKRQEEAAARLARGRGGQPLSFREARDVLERDFMRQLKGAPWKLADAELVPEAGPCTTCPHRSGNQRELFGDAGRADLCLSPGCYAKKQAAHTQGQLEAARAKNLEVVAPKASKKIFERWVFGGKRRLRNDSGYVELSDACDQDPKRRSYQRLLGKAATPTVAVDPEGKVRKLLPRKGITALLKERGHDFAEQRRASEARRQERTRQPVKKSVRDLRAEVARRASALCFEVALAEAVPEREAALWKLGAQNWLEAELDYDPEDRLRAQGLLQSKNSRGRDVQKAISNAPALVLRAMLIECLALTGRGDTWADSGLDQKGQYAACLDQVCRLHQVDLQAVEAEVVADCRALEVAQAEAKGQAAKGTKKKTPRRKRSAAKKKAGGPKG